MILELPGNFILKPKQYLSKQNFKNKQQQLLNGLPVVTNHQLGESSDTTTFEDTENSILEITNSIKNFLSFFQSLFNTTQPSSSFSSFPSPSTTITTQEINQNLRTCLSTIKEIGVYKSNALLNGTNNNQPDDEFDLSYILELLFQYILINKIKNDNQIIELFLWIFRIISLIISQDLDKTYTEILVSMGLLSHLKRIRIDIDSFIIDEESPFDNIDKIKFIINDIINQIQNFNNNEKYIFKQLYFNSFSITLRQLFYTNVGLGYKIWESSLLLSELILANSNTIFKNKTALELGSGIGLSGILASNFTKSIIITDFMDLINDNIKFNIDQNKINTSNNGDIKVVNLNWDRLEECDLDPVFIKGQKQFDVVFGSDLIYTQNASETVINVLSKFIKKETGVALLVLPECREGIIEFNTNLEIHPNLNIIKSFKVLNLGDDGDLLVYLINNKINK